MPTRRALQSAFLTLLTACAGTSAPDGASTRSTLTLELSFPTSHTPSQGHKYLVTANLVRGERTLDTCSGSVVPEAGKLRLTCTLQGLGNAEGFDLEVTTQDGTVLGGATPKLPAGPTNSPVRATLDPDQRLHRSVTITFVLEQQLGQAVAELLASMPSCEHELSLLDPRGFSHVRTRLQYDRGRHRLFGQTPALVRTSLGDEVLARLETRCGAQLVFSAEHHLALGSKAERQLPHLTLVPMRTMLGFEVSLGTATLLDLALTLPPADRQLLQDAGATALRLSGTGCEEPATLPLSSNNDLTFSLTCAAPEAALLTLEILDSNAQSFSRSEATSASENTFSLFLGLRGNGLLALSGQLACTIVEASTNTPLIATVTASNETGVFVGQSDEHGYLLLDLVPGRYDLVVEHPGSLPLLLEVDLGAGELLPLVLRLEPEA